MTISYTASQQQAINHITGNLQIIACAGSGKTQVLAQRIVNILATKKPDGLMPKNIVAFTFTEKAAGELKDRVFAVRARNELLVDTKPQVSKHAALVEKNVTYYVYTTLSANDKVRSLKVSVRRNTSTGFAAAEA